MLKSLDNGELKKTCTSFKVTFSDKDLPDVDANDIYLFIFF